MASTSLYNESSIPEMSSLAPTVPTRIENEELKWIWFAIPFVTALIVFFCFEFTAILLLCRRNRYRKAHLLFTDEDGQLMYSTDRINENVVLSGYRGIRTSISSSHNIPRHFASIEYCSMCGNTASRDGFMHDTSTFRGYRDHRRHTRDGLLLYGEPVVDHNAVISTMNDAASHDGIGYPREPSYNVRHVSRAFRELSSVSDVYTARSTDAEDDIYTPRFTPTVSRSISEDLAESETAPTSIERSDGELATQAQHYDSTHIHHHGNSLDSYTSTSSNTSDHQLLEGKPNGHKVVKSNGHRNFLNSYFVNRVRPNDAPHSKDPTNRLGGESVTTSATVEREQLKDDRNDRNSLVTHYEHSRPLYLQEEEDARHFIESYLANSCENVSVTAYSYV